MDDQENKLKGWGSHARVLTLSAAIAGIVQSATWVALTITAIVAFEFDCDKEVESGPEDGKKITDNFGQLLKAFYFTNCTDDEAGVTTNWRYITASDFYVWVIIILVFSIIWLISSSLMVFGAREKLNKIAAYFIIGWSCVTICICIIDLALGILLGLDLGNFENSKLAEVMGIGIARNLIRFSIGFMMTLAFKGFVLWIMNFTFSVLLISISVQILNPEEENKDYSEQSNMARSPINAFESPSNPSRPTTWLTDDHAFERPKNMQSNLYSRPYSMQGETNHGYMGMEPPKFQQQQPLASIMKRSVADQMNKPRGRNEPNLPSPDYSPPPMRGRPPFNAQMSNNSSQPSYYNNPYRR